MNTKVNAPSFPSLCMGGTRVILKVNVLSILLELYTSLSNYQITSVYNNFFDGVLHTCTTNMSSSMYHVQQDTRRGLSLSGIELS